MTNPADITEAAEHLVMSTKADIAFESDDDIDTLKGEIAAAIQAERDRHIQIYRRYFNAGWNMSGGDFHQEDAFERHLAALYIPEGEGTIPHPARLSEMGERVK